jgi:hypothetical protein
VGFSSRRVSSCSATISCATCWFTRWARNLVQACACVCVFCKVFSCVVSMCICVLCAHVFCVSAYQAHELVVATHSYTHTQTHTYTDTYTCIQTRKLNIINTHTMRTRHTSLSLRRCDTHTHTQIHTHTLTDTHKNQAHELVVAAVRAMCVCAYVYMCSYACICLYMCMYM